MNTQQAILATAATSDMVLKGYLSDLDDADLFRRPGPGCNHIAWQLGHLITSEYNLLNMLKPGAAPELPEGFAEKHDKETTGDDNRANFCTKQEYLELYDKFRAASAKVVASISDEELDVENPKEDMRAMVPTVGAMFVLLASHPMMHVASLCRSAEPPASPCFSESKACYTSDSSRVTPRFSGERQASAH